MRIDWKFTHHFKIGFIDLGESESHFFADVVVRDGAALFLTVLESLNVKITGDGEVFFKGDPIISADITSDGH